MQRQQKTLDSYSDGDTTESEEHQGAQSMQAMESAERVTYDDLIERVLDDENIEQALKQVVGNRGAPGADGMTVHELRAQLPSIIDALKDRIRAGKYKPSPVRRVEIPKPDGGVRTLGVPTVIDRLIQQAVAQVITPIYEPLFSESSFGFRPGRSPHDAIMQARRYIEEGYRYAVDLDLSKFFDTLNQDILMNVVRETIEDRTLVEMIKRFVKAGAVLPDGLHVKTDEGTPQGGPLSPILANIYLDRFDKLMEERGLHFIRYADDIVVFVKTPRASERVMQSCISFLEGKQMKLKVNHEKSSFGSPNNMKILGFKLLPRKDKVYVSVRVIQITKRNRGRNAEQMLGELRLYLCGWINYYGIATSRNLFEKLDGWIAHRVRQYIFRQWKKMYTRFRNLRNMCPPDHRGPEGSVSTYWIRQCWGVAKMSSWWKASRTFVVHQAMNRSWLREKGLYFLIDGWNGLRQDVRTAVYRTVRTVV